MRKIKEVLRLRYDCGLSIRNIARSVKNAHSTISDYLYRFEKSGISWPISEDISHQELEGRLFPDSQKENRKEKPVPNFSYIDKELKKRSVTLFLLWEEYREIYPEGYNYSRFCDLYRRYKKDQDLCLRQNYKGGDKCFVDFAGHTIPIHNRYTGEIRNAEIFVASLGASNFSYAEAVWSQQLPDWIQCHIHAFEYFKGVAKILVPDNLKAAVSKACRYDPDKNPTYQEMGEHYGTAIVPARSGKAQDKAKVESGVFVVERWILAAFRNYIFYSLEELNLKIRELLEKLNHRPFKKLPGCRFDLYQEVDLPNLLPLPEQRYEYGEWCFPKVHIDYHVEVDKHYYSVPYQKRGKKLSARYTARTVEIFDGNERVASHIRSYKIGTFTTDERHRPPQHREYLKWNAQRLLNWGSKIGPNCCEYLKALLKSRKYPELGYRACLGILRLSNHYPAEKMEEVFQRASTIKVFNYSIIANLLKQNHVNNKKRKYIHKSFTQYHENIRGSSYFEEEEREQCF